MTIWKPDILDPSLPKYLGLAAAIARSIENGELRPGDRLPPQRELADFLGVTVGTITRGYREAQEKGLLKGEVGRGTYVSEPRTDPTPLRVSAEYPEGVIDLSCAYPLYGTEPDLAVTLRRLSDSLPIQHLLYYQPSEGMVRHREAGVKLIKRLGMDVSRDRIIITCGSQHAINVIFSAVARPGDVILTESLTFPNVKALAALMNLRLHPVEIDDQGVIPESLAAACRAERVKALYLIPTLQNPTMAVLPEKRKRKIAAIARDFDIALIEDENYRLMVPDPPPLTATFAPERTFLIGGVSKCLASGLRIAFNVCPPQFYKNVQLNVASTMIMAVPLAAEIASQWILDGTFDQIMVRKRNEASARCAMTNQILKGFSYKSYEYGFFVWLRLPAPWSSSQFIQECFRRGIVLPPTESFVSGVEPAPNAVRISWSAAPGRQAWEKALRTMAEILSGPPSAGSYLL